MVYPTMLTGVSTPPPWEPEDLSNLVLYHDQGFDANPIGQWDDEVGSNNLTEATLKPDRVDVGSDYGARFVAANTDRLTWGSPWSLAGEFTIAFATIVNTQSDGNYVFSSSSDTSNYFRFRLGGASQFRIGGTALVSFGNGTQTEGSLQRWVMTRDGAGNVSTYLNGFDVSAAVSTANTLAGISQLGRDRAGANNLDADLYKFLVYDADHSASVADIDNWLNPYKTSMLGYVGASTVARIAWGMEQYQPGYGSWPGNTTFGLSSTLNTIYDGGTTAEWLDPGNGRWDTFRAMYAAYPFTSRILYMHANQTEGEADAADIATVVSMIRSEGAAAHALGTAPRVIVSGLMRFTDTCFSYPPESPIPAQTRTEASDAVTAIGDPDVVYMNADNETGGVFDPLTAATSSDGCHPNEATRDLNSGQLVTWLDANP